MNIIRNGNLDRYSYLDLTEDTRSSVTISFVLVGLALTILCDVPGSNDKMLVESNEDILRMFEIHNSREIKLYVDVMCSTLSQFGDVGMLLATSSLPATSAVHTGTVDSNDNISDSGDVEDYSKGIYGLSSEDDDLDMNKTDCGENIGKNNSDFTVDHGDGLSNFESDDDVEYDPSTNDSSSSEEDSVSKSTTRVFDQNLYGKEFNVKEGNKIVLKGIDRVIADVFPETSHRRCCRQLYGNMRGRFPRLLVRKYFWRAAGPYNAVEFREAMDHLKGVSADAHTWLTKLPIASWARHAFDPLLKNDHITNNLTKSFNNWVGNLRGKPIFTMLDGLRSKLMSRIRLRYEVGTTWEGAVTANVKKRLNKTATAARECTILFAGGMEFEVKDEQAAAIGYKRGNIEEYCDDAFSKEKYLAAHKHILHPIAEPKMWRAEAIAR
ncbi:hypothetical protein F0562_007634 [Nyssa sinensis]|uniref:Uncharacterized protein n=1 Tax=Nyssa sinensis TaxID=561372 RepID=A0A5J5A683_9ASTE|nr:hypothetical protein F0562_007634 [Nyssa sinensis]